MDANEHLYTNRIYNMDAIQGMKLLPDSIIDLVITDPPFAIDFRAKRSNYHRVQDRVIEGYNEISREKYYDFTIKWLSECYRLLKRSGSIYLFSGWNNLKDILNAIDYCKFITVNHIIWQYQFGVVTERKYVTSHYHCLYLCKDEKRRKFFPYARFRKDERDEKGSLHYRDKEDVWYIKREYWHGDIKTATKLPSELIRKILAYSSEEGDLVLDPFLGSGQVAVVSREMNRRYIGFEISKSYFEFARKRLEEGVYRISSD